LAFFKKKKTMEFDLYFKPVSAKIESLKKLTDSKDRLIEITLHTEKEKIKKIEDFDIALIGVCEERASENQGTKDAPNEIREKLYKLFKPSHNLKICDLGNLTIGQTLKDTNIALRDAIIELRSKNVVPILLGGSQELSVAIYEAYRKIETHLNLVFIDSRIDFISAKSEIISDNYIQRIIQSQNNRIFNISVLGYQNYLNNPKTIERMRKNLLDAIRLGELKQNILNIEPILRDANFVSFDISAIKQSDAPAHYNPSPNGFDAIEACQIAKYAGISDNVSCFGLFEVNPIYDRNGQTAHLAAQIIWHFIEGFYERLKDIPIAEDTNYKKFHIIIENVNQNFIFYKSLKTNRWWIEIPLQANTKKLVACSYEDYQMASNQDIPDIWWKTLQKLNR